MTRRLITVSFDNEGDLLTAVRAASSRGIPMHDVYTPYPVHGLSEAMALPPSRLSWIAFAAAVIGTAAITYFIFWTSAVSWPLNIGGKPWNSLPGFMPPIFETMVLSAALSAVVGFIVLCGLSPGRESAPHVEGATDDLFVVALEPSERLGTEAAAEQWFAPYHVCRVGACEVRA